MSHGVYIAGDSQSKTKRLPYIQLGILPTHVIEGCLGVTASSQIDIHLKMRRTGVLRKEVLIPGEILEKFGSGNYPGRHHGSVVKVETSGDQMVAQIRMTDFKSIRVTLPVTQVREYILETKGSERRTKRQRAETQYSSWKRPTPPPSMPLQGPALRDHIQKVESECQKMRNKPGTRCWVNLGPHGNWPAIIWSIKHCRKDDLADVLMTRRSGAYLVKFYGEHSCGWFSQKQVRIANDQTDPDMKESLSLWGKRHKKARLVKLAIMELQSAEKDRGTEIQRVASLYDMHTVANKRYKDICQECSAPGAPLKCPGCDRKFHTLCLICPALTDQYLPDRMWRCPCCDLNNEYNDSDHAEDMNEENTERMGLTPDWIISKAAFDVFGLQRPTVSNPSITKLLDPCTNSKVAPNIPAEKLYDRMDNGLKLTNSWAGYYVILNPDFSSQIQWRFVNRAIDEVENGSVPAIILICRNSTDTAFYQRLRPYPRVHLKRMAVLFKDYSSTPIGFGISIFCLAKANRESLYPKFYTAFEEHGEPNIPVDKSLVQTDEFWALLDRLSDFVGNHHRDHWVKCNLCAKWRIVPHSTVIDLSSSESGNDQWDCSMLSKGGIQSTCATPLTRMEYIGGHYVARDEDDVFDPEYKTFDGIAPDVKCPQKSEVQIPSSKKRRQGNPHLYTKLNKIIQEIEENTMSDSICNRISSENVDLKSYTALELARKARMAANKAYLARVGKISDEDVNNAGCGFLVSKAAKKLASHVAKDACSAEIERARQIYTKVNAVLSEEEAPLLRELEKIRNAKNQAKNNLEAAVSAARIIEEELSA